MYPRLFELPWSIRASGRSPSTPTACCWPPPTCSACSSRWCARKARGLDATRVLDLGIYIIISALVGAKLLLLVTDFQTFTSQPARAADARALGRRLLRRPDPRRRRRALVHPPRRPAAVDDVRCVRAGHRARPRRRPLRLLLRRLLLRQADDAAVGASRSPIRSPPPTSARRSACRCIRRSSTRRAPSC